MILTGMCDSAKLEMMDGVHRPTDRYCIALYGVGANLSKTTTRYTPEGECVGQGYEARGQILQGRRSALINGIACLTFTSPTWDRVTISAVGAMIYNASRADAALAVMRFDKTYSPENGEFEPEFPAMTDKTAMIRLR